LTIICTTFLFSYTGIGQVVLTVTVTYGDSNKQDLHACSPPHQQNYRFYRSG